MNPTATSKSVYLFLTRNETFSVVSADTPARSARGMVLAEEVPVGLDAEFHFDNRWQKGWRVEPPREVSFILNVSTFLGPREVARAVQTALTNLQQERDTPLPWFKLSQKE